MRPSAVGRRRQRANYNSASFFWLRKYPCPSECPASRRRSTFRATTAAFRVLLCFPSALSLTGSCRRRSRKHVPAWRSNRLLTKRIYLGLVRQGGRSICFLRGKEGNSERGKWFQGFPFSLLPFSQFRL